MLLSKVSPFRKIALVNWKKREVISLDFSDVFVSSLILCYRVIC